MGPNLDEVSDKNGDFGRTKNDILDMFLVSIFMDVKRLLSSLSEPRSEAAA